MNVTVNLTLINKETYPLVSYTFDEFNENIKKEIEDEIHLLAVKTFNLVNILGPKAVVIDTDHQELQRFLIKKLRHELSENFSFEKLSGGVQLLSSLPFYTEEPRSLRSKVKNLGQFGNVIGIGIGVGPYRIRGVCIDENGNIIIQKEMETKKDEGHWGVIERIKHLTGDILESLDRKNVTSIGIGIPGGISPFHVVFGHIFDDWENINLKEELENEFGIATFVENDANVIAIDEKELGWVEGDFITLVLGKNVGGAIIKDDRLLHGENYFAGELGHIVIDSSSNAPQCGCGNYGCLEIKVRSLFERFEQNPSEEILEKIAKYVAKTIKLIEQVTQVRQVLIGSFYAKLGYDFFQMVREYLKTTYVPDNPVKIYESSLERLSEPKRRYIGAIGAAILGMQKKEEIDEKAIVLVKDNYEQLGKETAKVIANQIKRKPDSVLGLATGSTPISTYKELVRMHNEDGLDFSQVTTFNLDEYYPIERNNSQSYYHYMYYWLFDHVNIKKENIHVPNGEIPADQVETYCKTYERQIEAAGGIDIQILGIGGSFYNEQGELRGGHIGFNEAGSKFNSKTRKVELADKTRTDNARFFKDIAEVPTHAITMGIDTILGAKRIMLLASGEHKAEIVKRSVEGNISTDIPATSLQAHPNTTFLLEDHAASQLSRNIYPWLFFDIDWTKELIKDEEITLIDRAVVWLSQKTQKPLEQLNLQDFYDNFLSDLLKINNYNVTALTSNIQEILDEKIVFKEKLPRNKRILIISPSPGDDAISLGNVVKLLNLDNDVVIANITSGNRAVKNSTVIDYCQHNQFDDAIIRKIRANELPSEELMDLKTLVRKTEAIQAHAYLGMTAKQQKFLNAPFYSAASMEGAVLTEQDILVGVTLLKQSFDIIFIPDEVTDPHGVTAKVRELVQQALSRVNLERVTLWLYKSGFTEYTIHEADVVFPFSEKGMDLQILAIKQLKSQLQPLFPGDDPRSSWRKSKQSCNEAGSILVTLGLVSEKYNYATYFKLINHMNI